jgi:hypothetical protein
MADPIREYTGEQIILASNQLFFNARKDNVELLSGKTIHLAANKTIQLDVGLKGSTDKSNKFVVNAPNIQLGLTIKGRTLEPIVKGDKLEEILIELIDILSTYSDIVSASVPPFSGPLAAAASALKLELNNLKIDFPEMKSDTSYTI